MGHHRGAKQIMLPNPLASVKKSTRSKGNILLFFLLLFEAKGTFLYAREQHLPEVSLYGKELLTQINHYRQDNGLNMLHFDPSLVRLAKIHSLEMFQQKMVSHYNFEKRMKIAGKRICIEIIGWNNNNSQERFYNWQQSSDNNQNMLAYGIVKAGIAETGNYVTFFACSAQ